jgi:hypothetical protein
MRSFNAPFIPVMASILITGGAFIGLGYSPIGTGEALAATQQEKTQARQDLDQVVKSLQAVDTAYASGNAAEAQTRYDDARTSWNKVSSVISAREAREAQLLFDSLGDQLKTSAPPAKVKSTVNGMREELREDIARELR